MLQMFFLLAIGHAVADFGLQNDFLAIAKSRHDRIYNGENIWFWVLGAHSLIHAGAVYIVTGSALLALCELIAHFAVDFAKCENWFSFHVDQLLHYSCKVLWITLIFHGIW